MDESISVENNPQKLLFIFGVIFIILIVGLFFFLFAKLNSEKISDVKLSKGITLNLEQNKKIGFSLNEEKYELFINSIQNISIELIIQNNSASFIVGDIKKFDLNSDGTYDLSIKLNNISEKNAQIYLYKLTEKICVENWVCTNWGNCTIQSQTRLCNDLNKCGTIKNKPAEINSCITKNCSEKMDIDCFIDFAGSCKLSNITYQFTMNVLGWIQNNSYYYKILGFKNSKCSLQQMIISSSGKYSETKKQSLLNEGKTEFWINRSEQERNEALDQNISKIGICRYSTSDLKDMLTDLKEKGVLLPIKDSETYECAGALYGENVSIS